jgi:hypothetical protein
MMPVVDRVIGAVEVSMTKRWRARSVAVPGLGVAVAAVGCSSDPTDATGEGGTAAREAGTAGVDGRLLPVAERALVVATAGPGRASRRRLGRLAKCAEVSADLLRLGHERHEPEAPMATLTTQDV